MSKVILGQSDGHNLKLDVDLLLTSRLLLQANSGGGKSWLLRRLAEQFYGHVQTIIIDPEGEFYTLREKYGYVLVGEGGETPCDVRSAAMLAERFLELKASAVCDLYEAFRSRPLDRRQWVRTFINALLDAPRSMWHPLIVIVDEAHKFCPQETPKAGNQIDREIIGGCKDAMIALSTTGRKRGFCPIWATQRLAKVDKDASAEMFNRMVGMTIEDVDVDRAADLMSVSRDDKQEFRQSLRTLSPGQFYAFGRAITNERKLVMVGEVFTHHPSTGMAAKYETAPPMPDEVKRFLPQLADLPKEAEEKVKNIAALQQEVRELKRELKQRPAEQRIVEKPKIVDRIVRVPTVPKEVVRALDKLYRATESVQGLVSEIRVATDVAIRDFKAEPPTPSPMPTLVMKPRSEGVTTMAARTIAARSNSNGTHSLPPGERAVLIAVAQFGSVEKDQLSVLTGYKRSSRDAYIARLSARGYVTASGRTLLPTQSGIDSLGGDYEPLPTGHALYEHWRNRLPEGELKILDNLVRAGIGQTVDKDVLMESTGYKRSSLDAYLSRLAAKRLVSSPGARLAQASDALYD